MKIIDEKNLLISLIRDDLINNRLVNGLESLGLDAGSYHVHLGQTVFDLLEIPNDRDDLFEEYMEMCNQASTQDIFRYPDLLNNTAIGIYKKLIREIGRENTADNQ